MLWSRIENQTTRSCHCWRCCIEGCQDYGCVSRRFFTGALCELFQTDCNCYTGTYWIVCRCYIRVVIDFRFRSFRNFLVLNFEVAWHDPQRRLKHLGLLSDMFEKFSRGTWEGYLSVRLWLGIRFEFHLGAIFWKVKMNVTYFISIHISSKLDDTKMTHTSTVDATVIAWLW